MSKKKNDMCISQIYRYGFNLCLEVYEKYNRKCSVCDAKERLAVHHIDGSGKSNNPNDNIKNLQLMCLSCHQSLHSTERWAEKAKVNGGYKKKGREKEYYNSEYQKEYQKKWRENHKECSAEYNKKWRENHKEYCKEYHDKYRIKHRLTTKYKECHKKSQRKYSIKLKARQRLEREEKT